MNVVDTIIVAHDAHNTVLTRSKFNSQSRLKVSFDLIEYNRIVKSIIYCAQLTRQT